MADLVDFVNTALSLIGHDGIASLDIPNDPTQADPLVAQILPILQPTIDMGLRAAHWNCATARQTLSQTVAYVGNEFGNAYQLPTDPYCIKARRIAGASLTFDDTPNADTDVPVLNDADRYHPAKLIFRVEGRLLLTNVTTPTLVYTARLTDPTLFDSEFYIAAATLLASFFAIGIRKDYKQQGELFKIWGGLRDEAKGSDESEGGKDEYVSTELLYHR